MSFSKYYYTIIHLKPIQLRYQLWYRFRNTIRTICGYKYELSHKSEAISLRLSPCIDKPKSYESYSYSFLNKKILFDRNNIDWEYNLFGKLWAYNLNYMDFLLQKDIKTEDCFLLLKNFISEYYKNEIGKEPYTIALRGINWIKFLSTLNSKNRNNLTKELLSSINNSLFAQYKILLNNIEYHLLGNHLMEDGFSLLFGAYYFRNISLLKSAQKLLFKELNEQILSDGAHFELSPMYHQILLERLLDCINLLQNNLWDETQPTLLDLLKGKAVNMLKWINTMTFSNGEIPLLNDAAFDIAPKTDELNQYAIRLNLITHEDLIKLKKNTEYCLLKGSSYRRFDGLNYECIVDIGGIDPSYQCGHAHADTFSFVVNANNQPFIIDTGVSTYEINKQRLFERGTSSHNTVIINGGNSSTIWSGFRVAQRAKVTILKDELNIISASHDGYKKLGELHERTWRFTNQVINIEDKLTNENTIATANYIFHVSSHLEKTKIGIKTSHSNISFDRYSDVQIEKVKIPNGYNQFSDGWKVSVIFKGSLQTQIAFL